MSFNEKIPEKENKIEGRETNVFNSTPSTFFKITTSDKTVRELMDYIQQEEIDPQNTFSESRAPNAKDRILFLWVNEDDAGKITEWLQNQSLSNK